MTPVALVKDQLFSIVARVIGSEGGHTIMFVYDDGWAEAAFSVVGDHSGSEDENTVDDSEPSLSKSSSPQTGDTTRDNMPAYALLIMLSLAGIVVADLRKRGYI